MKEFECENVFNKRRKKYYPELLRAGGNAGRFVAGDLEVIPVPVGPRPRPSYVLHAFLDTRHLGEEQRSLVFAVWAR